MNPTRFLLLLAIAALLGSCTKDYPLPENATALSQSAIEFFYPDDSDIGDSGSRIAPFVPLSTSQPCKSNTSSILAPQIIEGDSINIVYANIAEFSSKVDPKSIEWKVNGETANQLSTILYIPYEHGEYDIEATVTLTNDSKRLFEFTLNVTHDMPLDNEGYIEFDEEDSCVTGPTVGQSCLPQNGRNFRIIIVEPIGF